VADLIGNGLNDRVSQAAILNKCAKDFPGNRTVLKSCGNMVSSYMAGAGGGVAQSLIKHGLDFLQSASNANDKVDKAQALYVRERKEGGKGIGGVWGFC
jgi:hypothetical protein